MRYIVTLIVFVGMCAVLGGAWWFFGAQNKNPVEMSAKIPVTPAPAQVQEVPAPVAERVVAKANSGEGVRAYKNEKYRFSLSYPQSLSVKEYDERNGAMSATFESAIDEKSFQIYVTPYKEEQITEERFRLDVPSGVRKDVIEIVIDGSRAIMFFSENSFMGETREVWFIKSGFLYEVVTYKDLDTWLGEIMKTWKFL